MLKKIKKFLKKLFKIKKKKKVKNKLETIQEREITEEKVEEDLIEIRLVDEVLDDLYFSSSTYSPSSSLSFFSVDEMENDLKIMKYNQLIDSIELP
jgi:hypothetical protein